MARAKSEPDVFRIPKVARKPSQAPKSPAAENWNPFESARVGATENQAPTETSTATRTIPHALFVLPNVGLRPRSWLVGIVYLLFGPPSAQQRTRLLARPVRNGVPNPLGAGDRGNESL